MRFALLIDTYRNELVVLGIVLAVVGSTTSGWGMNLMKASSRLEHHLPWYRRKRLLMGVSLAT